MAFNGTMLGTMNTRAASSGSLFYFHYKSQLYRSDNASATLLELADLNAPTAVGPHVVEVASAIRNVTTIFGTVWVGTVGWITSPLSASTAIHGVVNFQVWLSTTDNDVQPAFSGIGAGIAVLDQHNQTIGNYTYSYRYTTGSYLTGDARPYILSVDLNRAIASGQRLVLAVGAGSTSLGWRMKVYFDAAEYPSQVELPINVLVVPEFAQTSVSLAVLAALLVSSLGLVRGLRRGNRRIPHANV